MSSNVIKYLLLSGALIGGPASTPSARAANVESTISAPATAVLPIDGKELQKQRAIEAKAEKARARAEQRKMNEWRRLYGLGPYPDEIDNFISAKPVALRQLYQTLYLGGERNAVLNFERLGLAAIETQDWKDAEWAFDGALSRIEAIYANNPRAEAARSSFHNEANKDFKGEPYERAMAYYYRGLLYLRAGDFDNARASFKAAEFQDTVSEAETFQGDFAAMNYLVGWTQHCQGQTAAAQESFNVAALAQEGLTPPKAGDNILMIAELGYGPRKTRGGSSEEKLIFSAGPDYPEKQAVFKLQPATGAAKEYQTSLASNLSFQAMTRGGRPIDGILAGKASLKETTASIGDVAMTTGLSQIGSDFGSAAAGVGMLFSLFSSTVKTKADVREWDGLPDLITIATARAPSPDWTYEVLLSDGNSPLDSAGVAKLRAASKACNLAWARSRSVAALPVQISGEDEGVAQAVRRKKDVQQKDKLFRQSLESSAS